MIKNTLSGWYEADPTVILTHPELPPGVTLTIVQKVEEGENIPPWIYNSFSSPWEPEDTLAYIARLQYGWAIGGVTGVPTRLADSDQWGLVPNPLTFFTSNNP